MCRTLPTVLVVTLSFAGTAMADWPQWGGTAARNAVAVGHGIPVHWDVGKIEPRTNRWLGSNDKQIRWVARLGTCTYGSPVLADGKVFCATNNGAGHLARYPAKVDLGCLLCFRQAGGQFLWQYSAEKLTSGQMVDYPDQGICCSPLVEGKRLWIVTNRGEVVCLDTEGAARGEARIAWRFDMMRELGVVQRYMCSCSVTSAGDLLLVCTANGMESEDKLPAPDAPSFIALDKHTGKLVWADRSPGRNILEGQWGSPASAVLGGVPQAIFPGGDGWLYSFRAAPAQGAQPELLWKYDCNPKEAVWKTGGAGTRNHIIATPVVCDGRVYVGTGQDPEAGGDGQGDLWCIDPTRRGDVSAELAVDRTGQPLPVRRVHAVDQEAGEQVRPNPNSACLWHYRGAGGSGDDFKNIMHRTLGMVAVHDGLLVAADFAGLVHCLDAKTGAVQWTHDMMSDVWGSPLIADGKIYLGDADGDVVVFALARKLKLWAKNNMGNSVYGMPVVADNVLYVASRTHLFAIAAPAAP